MSTPCFELRDWTDLLTKAKSDLSQLEKLVNSYDVFNCLWTLNHIPDWVLNGDANETLKQAASKIKNNSKIRAVYDLCNRAKHFKPDRQKTLKTDVQDGYGTGRYGVGKYGVGEPSYSVEVDGQMLNVLELLRDVLAQWDALRT